MTILCLSSSKLIPETLKGKYVLTFNPGIGNLWLDIDDIFLVLEAFPSATGNSIMFEAIERAELPMFFENGRYIFREKPESEQMLPWKFRYRRDKMPVLLCDTIEEVIQVRNRELERTEARKRAIKEVEGTIGFNAMVEGQTFNI